MLKIQHISAAYHKGYPILEDVNLELGSGGRMAILGRNGAGKTTFANSIFGLVPRVSGEIWYDGKDLGRIPLNELRSAGLGYFMQGAPVFPQLSIRENLLFAAGKIKMQDFHIRMDTFKASMPLMKDPQIDKMPAGSLSGGERTQLAIAMAIFNRPSLLILDEPFAGLSPANANLVLHILEDYHESSGASLIMIAQDRQLAFAFCDAHYLIRDNQLIRE